MEEMGPDAFPTDQTITEVHRIVESSDLMSVSKKSIREAFAEHFGVDLNSKRQLISDYVDELLERMLAQ